jgi:hypothetical protein
MILSNNILWSVNIETTLFFQYLTDFNIFEGQELRGGAEFVLTGGKIAVAEFQLNAIPGIQANKDDFIDAV